MTKDFKILNEEIFNYKRNNELCLMLLRDGTTYSVEIVSKQVSYGRKFCTDRIQAEKVFDFLTEKLSLINDYDTAIKLLISCYKVSLGEMKFLFMVYEKKLSQIQIGKLISEFKLKIRSRVKANKEMKIRIYFGKDTKCFGYFTGTFLKKDFIFNKT